MALLHEFRISALCRVNSEATYLERHDYTIIKKNWDSANLHIILLSDTFSLDLPCLTNYVMLFASMGRV